MPRIARGLIDNGIYHVINRGNRRLEVFHNDEDYKRLIELLGKAKERALVKVLGYCLMPNHFHLLLQPVQGEQLGRYMQWLMTSYVRQYNKLYGMSGHIWQGRYKSFLIQEDEYFLNVLRYIEANPVRANLVQNAKDWRYSSHTDRINNMESPVLDELPMKLPQSWNRFVNEPVKEKKLEEIRNSVNRQTPYGMETWQRETSIRLGLESTLKPRGRPKKVKNDTEK